MREKRSDFQIKNNFFRVIENIDLLNTCDIFDLQEMIKCGDEIILEVYKQFNEDLLQANNSYLEDVVTGEDKFNNWKSLEKYNGVPIASIENHRDIFKKQLAKIKGERIIESLEKKENKPTELLPKNEYITSEQQAKYFYEQHLIEKKQLKDFIKIFGLNEANRIKWKTTSYQILLMLRLNPGSTNKQVANQLLKYFKCRAKPSSIENKISQVKSEVKTEYSDWEKMGKKDSAIKNKLRFYFHLDTIFGEIKP